MIRKKSTAKHLDSIWSSLAQRMSDEYLLAGFSLPQAKDAFLSSINAGIGHTLFDADGAPIAIMIWQDDDRGIATSFAAKEEFFTSAYVRPFRRYMDEFQGLRHNACLISHSYSVHPDVPNWFRFLKFELESENGPHRVFVRRPRP